MSAPAADAATLSASARLTWRGAVVVVTVSADDPAIIARRLGRTLDALAAATSSPAPSSAPAPVRPDERPTAPPAPNRNPTATQPDAAPPVPLCGAHGAPLTWRTPKGGGPGWWSHRTPDGAWCRG